MLYRRLLLPLPQKPEDEEFVLQHSLGNCSLLLALHRGLKLGHVAAPRAPVAIEPRAVLVLPAGSVLGHEADNKLARGLHGVTRVANVGKCLCAISAAGFA
jgi:hypothetical protein